MFDLGTWCLLVVVGCDCLVRLVVDVGVYFIILILCDLFCVVTICRRCCLRLC